MSYERRDGPDTSSTRREPGTMPSEPVPVVVLRPPGRAPYVVTLDQLTAQVAAARTLRTMNFLEKMKLAGTVAADLEAAAERDADALIARGAELDAKRTKAFAPHFKRMDASHDALDGLEHALDYLGNGTPATGSDVGKPAAAVGSDISPKPTTARSVTNPDGSGGSFEAVAGHPPQVDDPNLPHDGNAYHGTA